jgi:hypothetical protein
LDGLSITEAGADGAGDGAAGADAAGAVDVDGGASGGLVGVVVDLSMGVGVDAGGVDWDGGASDGFLELAPASRLGGPRWAAEAGPGMSIEAVGAP